MKPQNEKKSTVWFKNPRKGLFPFSRRFLLRSGVPGQPRPPSIWLLVKTTLQIFLKGWLRFHSMCIACFLHPYIHGWVFRWLCPVLAVGNNLAMNTGAPGSLQDPNFTSFGWTPDVESLDHMVVLFLIFWDTSILFFIAATPFYLPTTNKQGSQFQSRLMKKF